MIDIDIQQMESNLRLMANHTSSQQVTSLHFFKLQRDSH